MTASTGSTQVTTTTTDIDVDANAGPRTDARKAVAKGVALRHETSGTPSIADQYSGLLDDLTPGQCRGLIAKLSAGYYDGWRPTRAELARIFKMHSASARLGVDDQKNSFLRTG